MPRTTRRTFTFGTTRVFRGDPTRALELEAHSAHWWTWAGPLFGRFRAVELAGPDGSGELRELSLGPLSLRERTVEYVPGIRHVYTMEPFGPMRDYRATVSVSPLGDERTRLDWGAEFTAPSGPVGEVLLRTMDVTIGVLAGLLAGGVEREHGARGPRRRPSVRSSVLHRVLRTGVRPVLGALPVNGPTLAAVRLASQAGGSVLLRPVSPYRYDDDGLGYHGDPTARRVVLFVHGGGFLAGSRRTHGRAASVLARDLGARVYLPEYRLAPESPHPAAVDDVRSVYRRLVERSGGPVDVVADSAGVWIALAATTGRDDELPAPRRIALISPWLTLDDFPDAATGDPLLPASVAVRATELYRAGAEPAAPPVLPPDGARDTAVLVVVGEFDFARYTWTAAPDAPPPVVDVWPGQVHCFALLDGVVPEARAALLGISAFLRDRTSGD